MKLKDASAKAAGAAEQGKGTFTAAFNDMTKVCKQCHEIVSREGGVAMRTARSPA